MSVFKCKMCGGALEIGGTETVAKCEYCGTNQTLPKLGDEKRLQLFDRANYFRRENEFDKAMGIYEIILAEDYEDSEAYWGIVLCKYGIEYVEDPRSHKRIPTVNRAQLSSVFDDKDFNQAIFYADQKQKKIYYSEAETIDRIQKGILEISSKEEPFDIFICYKETDIQGNRTEESVYAQDLYNALTKEGYKVFFSRITLENKLGQQYEPFIFAALHSAKVMLVIGTSKESFNAVWVKNEWSRFLALSKEDSTKTVIPCYKGVSPYEMPEEFIYLQSQDMGKIGYVQDVIHGIKKLIKRTKHETVVINSIGSNVSPLLKRAFLSLEDGEWENANNFCEQVLNQDPENAQAYLGKLMAELKTRKIEDLKNRDEPFDKSANYQKAIRFGDDALKSILTEDIEIINKSVRYNQLNNSYNKAIEYMQSAKDEDRFLKVAELFNRMTGFKESDRYAKLCLEKAEIARKENIYNTAKSNMVGDDEQNYINAIQMLESIGEWKDAKELIIICQNEIDEIQSIKEELRKEKKIKRILFFSLIGIVAVFAIVMAIINSQWIKIYT